MPPPKKHSYCMDVGQIWYMDLQPSGIRSGYQSPLPDLATMASYNDVMVVVVRVVVVLGWKTTHSKKLKI